MKMHAITSLSPTRRFWYLAVGGGLLVHALGLGLFRIEPIPESLLLVERPYLTLSDRGGDERRGTGFDRVALLDTAPLFLPSEWNTMSGNLARIRERKPADLFDDFPPELSFEDSGAAAELSLRLEGTAEPRPLLLARDRFPFAPFGRSDPVRETETTRFARIEVFRFGGAEPVYRFAVPAEEGSEAFDEATYPAEPMAFSVQVGPIGVLGAIFLLESSGSDEVDGFFRERVRENLREEFRRNGGPGRGYYRVEIGP